MVFETVSERREVGIRVDVFARINGVSHRSGGGNSTRTLHAQDVVDEFEPAFVPQFCRQFQGLHNRFDAGDDARRQLRCGGETRFQRG